MASAAPDQAAAPGLVAPKLNKVEVVEESEPEPSDDTSDVQQGSSMDIKRRIESMSRPGHAMNLMIGTDEESGARDDDGGEDQEEEDEDDEMQSGISDQDVEVEGD